MKGMINNMKKRLAFCAVFLTLISSVGFMTGCGSRKSSDPKSAVSKIGEISAVISIAPPTKSISDISFDQSIPIKVVSPEASTSNLVSIKEFIYNGGGPDLVVKLLKGDDTSGIFVWSVSFSNDDYMVVEAKATRHLYMTDEITEQFESVFLTFYKQLMAAGPSDGFRPFNLTCNVINDDGTIAASCTYTPNDI